MKWTTRAGKVRKIRLFMAWENMRGRCSGRLHAGNGSRPWRGLEIEWQSFAEFRHWAITHGYSKQLCSLDRINPAKRYGADNCRWLTVADNTRWMNFHHGAEVADVPF